MPYWHAGLVHKDVHVRRTGFMRLKYQTIPNLRSVLTESL